MPQNSPKKKVLMIEDDGFLRKLFKDKFKKDDFEFIEATNGLEGMNKVIADNPDVIILDMLLPRASGFYFLEEIKKKTKLKKIPVIVLSVLTQEKDIKEAMHLGALKYFKKSETSFMLVAEEIKKIINT